MLSVSSLEARVFIELIGENRKEVVESIFTSDVKKILKAFKNNIGALGYQDLASGYECSFGKLESCSEGVFFFTELDAWIVSRIYEWDSVEPISGYMSSTFRKPTDMSVLSVMRFYKAKNALKEFIGQYQQGKSNDVSGIRGLFPDSFVNDCERGDADNSELREYYMLSKADLNSLF